MLTKVTAFLQLFEIVQRPPFCGEQTVNDEPDEGEQTGEHILVTSFYFELGAGQSPRRLGAGVGRSVTVSTS